MQAQARGYNHTKRLQLQMIRYLDEFCIIRTKYYCVQLFLNQNPAGLYD